MEVRRLLQINNNLSLVLLDRDGVINVDTTQYIKKPDEWHAIEGSIHAIVALQRQYEVAVCSNQSGVARGYFSEQTLGQMHQKMNSAIVAQGGRPLDVYFCPHLPQAHCPCRKPKPQLLNLAMQSFGIGPQQTLYIGDSEKDLLAAQRAGCRAALVLTGKGQQTQKTSIGKKAWWVFDDLSTATAALCKTSKGPKRPN